VSQERTQPPRQFGEDEVAEILRRTSQLEQKKKLERPTLTQSEIETLAQESGLDPAMVKRAIEQMERDRGSKSFASRFVGGPTRHVFERELDGEITTEHHEQLAEAIRRVASERGLTSHVSTVGRSLTWTANNNQRNGIPLQLTVFPRDGKTILRLEFSTGQVAGGLFGGLMGGLGGGLGTNLLWILPVTGHLPWYTGVAAFAGVFGGAWGLARLIYGAIVNSSRRQAELMMDTLERAVSSLSLRAARGPG